MTMLVRLELDIKASVQDRGDYWAVYSEELGITAYGNNEQEAIANFEETMDDLLESFDAEPYPLAACREFMDAHGVKYSIEPVVTATTALVAPPVWVPHVVSERHRSLKRSAEYAPTR